MIKRAISAIPVEPIPRKGYADLFRVREGRDPSLKELFVVTDFGQSNHHVCEGIVSAPCDFRYILTELSFLALAPRVRDLYPDKGSDTGLAICWTDKGKGNPNRLLLPEEITEFYRKCYFHRRMELLPRGHVHFNKGDIIGFHHLAVHKGVEYEGSVFIDPNRSYYSRSGEGDQMEIKPVPGYVISERIKLGDDEGYVKSDHGIILNTETVYAKHYFKVVAIGSGVSGIKPGDIVIPDVAAFGAVDLHIAEKNYVRIGYNYLLGVSKYTLEDIQAMREAEAGFRFPQKGMEGRKAI